MKLEYDYTQPWFSHRVCYQLFIFHFTPVIFYHSYFLVFRFVDPPMLPFLLTVVEVRTCIGGNGDLYFNSYFLLTEAWTSLTSLYLRRVSCVFVRRGIISFLH